MSVRSVPVDRLETRAEFPTITRALGSCTGSWRSITALISVKIAVLAPMPSARQPTATAVKPGVRRRVRRAYLRSWRKDSATRSMGRLVQVGCRDKLCNLSGMGTGVVRLWHEGVRAWQVGAGCG